MRTSNSLNTREGTFTRGLHYTVEGSGPPLVMFRGVTSSSKNPTGLARWGERRFLMPLIRRFTVYSIGHRPDLGSGTTMVDLAADYAQALVDEFKGNAVDILGISTSGSIALQFAADYPGLVHKLALAGTSYRLGPIGRDVQRRCADLLASGDSRRALKALAPALTESRTGQWFFGGLMWLIAPLSRIEDPSGMVAVLMAEDAFDLGDQLSKISAPTLLIGGDRDRLYPPDLVKQTAERIPHARMIMYQGRGHRDTLTDRRLHNDILAFLTDEKEGNVS